MLVAKLIAIFTVKEAIDSGFGDYVKLRASYENNIYPDDHYVAILNIVGTSCYLAFFINEHTNINDIKDELYFMDTILNHDAEVAIKRFIDRLRDNK